MRIKSITVNGLFGLFNHRVDLHLDDRATIIHGPNGFGKTTILRLVASIFSADLNLLLRIPFRTFSVSFEDDSIINLEKVAEGHENDSVRISFGGYSYDLKARDLWTT